MSVVRVLVCFDPVLFKLPFPLFMAICEAGYWEVASIAHPTTALTIISPWILTAHVWEVAYAALLGAMLVYHHRRHHHHHHAV